MQMIETKYLCPTNKRGARIKAKASGGASLTIGYPHELNGVEVHAKAAVELARKLEWTGELVAGGRKDGSYVFCFVADAEKFTI